MCIRTGWSGSARRILFLYVGEKRGVWQEDKRRPALGYPFRGLPKSFPFCGSLLQDYKFQITNHNDYGFSVQVSGSMFLFPDT